MVFVVDTFPCGRKGRFYTVKPIPWRQDISNNCIDLFNPQIFWFQPQNPHHCYVENEK